MLPQLKFVCMHLFFWVPIDNTKIIESWVASNIPGPLSTVYRSLVCYVTDCAKIVIYWRSQKLYAGCVFHIKKKKGAWQLKSWCLFYILFSLVKDARRACNSVRSNRVFGARLIYLKRALYTGTVN